MKRIINHLWGASKNPKLCVTLLRQNAHLLHVNSAFVSVSSLDFEVFRSSHLYKTPPSKATVGCKRVKNDFSFFKKNSFLCITVLLLTAALTATMPCKAQEADLPPLEVSISGKISHTVHLPVQSGKVTFNRFPASVEEFMSVRERIGGEPHGAVALQVMAYEMYRRNRAVGEECIRLNNVTLNVATPLRRLNELFGNDDSYQRPYQMAAFLKGATAANGYRPNKPYTIEVRVSKGVKYQKSNDYQTTVLYLEVLTKGKDKGAEQVSVIKTLKPGEPGEGKYFIVFGSAGMYASVKTASFANPFQGLE